MTDQNLLLEDAQGGSRGPVAGERGIDSEDAYGPGLLRQHVELLRKSAITAQVAIARGYRSVTSKSELKRYGFTLQQCLVPALLIPIRNVSGEVVLHQIRPDEPRIRNGKLVKYETPAGTRMSLDVPLPAKPWLGEPSRPLLITEGARKADAAVSKGLCCVALLGVWNFRGTNEYGGKVALPDWECVALNGREVYIVFDSDVVTKPPVHEAMARLKALLEHRQASVSVVYLPPGEGGAKTGLDDFFAAGKGFSELAALATSQVRRVAEPDLSTGRFESYQATPEGLFWLKSTHDGPQPVQLTNFDARIVAEIIQDDGVQAGRFFEIEASCGERRVRFAVQATQFAVLNWPAEHLGSAAVIYPGFSRKEHARTAIQILSGRAPERRVYGHIGWRQHAGEWFYLHAGGGIGAGEHLQQPEVRLPEALSNYHLPPPPNQDLATQSVRSSLALLDVGPAQVLVPLYSSIWRAALGPADFSVHLAGPTGAGKTALAALVQQHWGPRMEARRLPASWLSTGNALERLCSVARDAIIVVDDFAPAGGFHEVGRFHREADRLLRAQGNRAGRQRLGIDASLKEALPPAGLILSTGEDVPGGHSLRSRVLVLELGAYSGDGERLFRRKVNTCSGDRER